HIKLAGDLLVFLMHTNIVTLEEQHGFNKSDYVQENAMRKYLGQINIYNFMADSFKYNRLNDPGYLLARLFVNHEAHFMVEGEGQLRFIFESFSKQKISTKDLQLLLQIVLNQAIESDLITRPFKDIRYISVQEKIQKSQQLGAGYKIGFQMKNDDKIK
ncbi:MAG: hypothetical protein R3345_00945, partial [Fulvivirga sp.]|nr:hypothetical protein [Fulvivirga sp.]